MSEETIQLVITSIVAPMVLYSGKLMFDFGIKVLNMRVSNSNVSEKTTPSLGEHPFFERMRYLDNHIQFCFSIPNKGKEAVFKDILSHYTKVHVKHLQSFIEQDFDIIEDMQLANTILTCLDKASVEFNTYYKNSGYTEDEQKTLDIVMLKFNKWHLQKTEQTYRSVQMVCNSKFYSTPHVKMSVILDLLLGSFVDTINDAEMTLNELNGDLKGLVYKNIQL